jgi:NitT/TauT family transport system permease protein
MGVTAGLGVLMVTAAARCGMALVFCGLAAIAVMAVGLFVICVAIERRMVRWAFRGELVM